MEPHAYAADFEVMRMPGPYYTIMLGYDGRMALCVRDDGGIEVNWDALRSYASTVSMAPEAARHPHFATHCLVHALLAVHDGRVVEI